MLIGKFDITHRRGSIGQHLNAETAERARIINPNRWPECVRRVVRERDIRLALVALGHEPRDSNIASARAHGRAVNGAGINVPSIVMHDRGTAPASGGKT